MAENHYPLDLKLDIPPGTRVITPRILKQFANRHSPPEEWRNNEYRYDRKVRGIVTRISEIHEPSSYGDIWDKIIKREPTSFSDVWDTFTNRRSIDFSLDNIPCKYITMFSNKDRCEIEDVYAWLKQNYGKEVYVRGHYLRPQIDGNRVLPSILLVDDFYRGPDFKSRITKL